MLNLKRPYRLKKPEWIHVRDVLLPYVKLKGGEKGWSKGDKKTKSLKNNISEYTIIHQKNCCVYCEELMFGGIQLDHIVPKKLHPEYCFEPKNLVSSCAICNMYVKNAGDTIVGTPAKRYNKNQFTIVHPYFDDPDYHIKYTNADKVVIDYANSTKLGKATIDFFHLNDYQAYCIRAKRFGNAKKYPIDFIRLAKETSTYKP